MIHQANARKPRRAIPASILALALLTLSTITNTLNAAPTFTDVTIAAGVDYLQWQGLVSGFEVLFITGGAAVADVDGDGYPDLYVTRVDGPDILFRNNQAGGFDDVTVAAGLSANLPTNGPAFADIDNDGDQDLYVTSVATRQHYLYINDGTGHFTEEALARGAAIDTGQIHFGFSTTFGDYDGDGYLDLYVSEWGNQNVNPPDELRSHARLLRNLGAANPGHFEDKTLESGVYLDDSQAFGPNDSFPGVFAFTPTFADFNLDGLPDLAIAGDFHTSRLYWNNGDGTFTQAPGPTDPSPSGIGTDENGMGSAVADYNGDGLLDWFVTSIYDPADPCGVGGQDCNWSETGNRLYQNNGDQTFTDVTDVAGVRDGGWGWGSTFLDYDNDGDLDLTMTNGFLSPNPSALPFRTDPVKLWQNDGFGSFTEVAAAEGITDTGSGKGILTFDYDLDGDLDLFIVNNNGHPKLYRNDSDNTNAYLRIDPQGVTSNSDGIGALITVTPDEGGPSQTRYITGGNNYLSQSELIAHFGLGPRAEPVHMVTVQWATGVTQSFFNVPLNLTLTATEVPKSSAFTFAGLDIKPGSDQNPINLKSRGVLPVAILTTAEFDALQVDLASIVFGDPVLLDDGAIGVGPLRSHEKDVNGDGLTDLTLKFSMRDLVDNGALGGMSMEALLTGLTFDGMMFEGTDLLRIVPPGDANNDGLVNAADYTAWANGFGGASPRLTDGDFNGDGSVDVADYTVLANNFEMMVAGPESSPQAVPEPSTFLLAIVGIIGLSAFHRRRRRYFTKTS